MLKHIGKKKQWIDGKGLKKYRNCADPQGKYIFPKWRLHVRKGSEQIIIITRALVEQEKEKSIPVAV